MDTNEVLTTIERFLIKYNLPEVSKKDYDLIHDIMEETELGIATNPSGSNNWQISDIAITLLGILKKLIPFDHAPYEKFKIKKYKKIPLYDEDVKDISNNSKCMNSTHKTVPDIKKKDMEQYNNWCDFEELEEGYDCVERDDKYLISTIIALGNNVNHNPTNKILQHYPKHLLSDITYKLFDIKYKDYYEFRYDYEDGANEDIFIQYDKYKKDQLQLENIELKKQLVEQKAKNEELLNLNKELKNKIQVT